jgi:hypothetical protein
MPPITSQLLKNSSMDSMAGMISFFISPPKASPQGSFYKRFLNNNATANMLQWHCLFQSLLLQGGLGKTLLSCFVQFSNVIPVDYIPDCS